MDMRTFIWICTTLLCSKSESGEWGVIKIRVKSIERSCDRMLLGIFARLFKLNESFFSLCTITHNMKSHINNEQHTRYVIFSHTAELTEPPYRDGAQISWCHLLRTSYDKSDHPQESTLQSFLFSEPAIIPGRELVCYIT